MQKRLVLTITGSDRVGIVDEVTKVVLSHNGNVEASRMSRLGGEFAMLMLISVEATRQAQLQDGLNGLRTQGFDVVLRPTVYNYSQNFAGWHSYQIGVHGADHEGIIHEITKYLAQAGINVETLDTGTEDAPFGGTVLFSMSAVVVAPPQMSISSVQEALASLGDQLHVDIEITAAED